MGSPARGATTPRTQLVCRARRALQTVPTAPNPKIQPQINERQVADQRLIYFNRDLLHPSLLHPLGRYMSQSHYGGPRQD